MNRHTATLVARAGAFADALRQDLRHAARLLWRQPLFTLTAALSLAVGIGANTTIFTVANGLLFRAPAGVTRPDALVDIGRTDRQRGGGFNTISYPNYLDIRARATTLEDIYAAQPIAEPMSLRGPAGAERIFGKQVTSNYFTVLGARPAAGRLFADADGDATRAAPIVVLSHTLWARRFHQSPTLVGQTLHINGHPLTVVGIAPEGFQGTNVLAADAWVPIGGLPSESTIYTRRDLGSLILGGRVKTTVRNAAAELDTIARALELEHPDANKGQGLNVSPSALIPGNLLPVRAFLALLMVIVSLVLMTACTNVAGVLLARATTRRREIAVRLAIGAGRARVIRQLLTETLLLFLLGGTAGLLMAHWMTAALVSQLPTLPVPIDVSLALDARVLAFTTTLSLLAALLCGLAPALQASRADVVSALKDDSQGPSPRARLRHAFVVGQVAFSIVLVIIAGLFARALQRSAVIDPGFDPRGVELASLDLSLAGYTAATGIGFARELVSRVRALPGVQAATLAHSLPMGDRSRLFGLSVPGSTTPKGEAYFEAESAAVEPAYFETMRIPLVRGRDFSAADRDSTQPVAIVSESAARRFWPGQDGVGKSLRLDAGPWRKPEDVRTLTVIGVARDIPSTSRRDGTLPSLVYRPLQQAYHSRLTIVARTTHGQRLASEIRALVASLNPNVPIVTAQTLEDFASVRLVPQRVAASVAGSLGLVCVLLAAMGIYGVTAYAVARRTREIGVRIALGATRADVIAVVLRHGLSLAALGAAIGLTLAAASSRLLTTWLFGLPPIDPVTFAGAALLFALVGLAACYVPVRRATRIEAATALRYE